MKHFWDSVEVVWRSAGRSILSILKLEKAAVLGVSDGLLLGRGLCTKQ